MFKLDFPFRESDLCSLLADFFKAKFSNGDAKFISSSVNTTANNAGSSSAQRLFRVLLFLFIFFYLYFIIYFDKQISFLLSNFILHLINFPHFFYLHS